MGPSFREVIYEGDQAIYIAGRAGRKIITLSSESDREPGKYSVSHTYYHDKADIMIRLMKAIEHQASGWGLFDSIPGLELEI